MPTWLFFIIISNMSPNQTCCLPTFNIFMPTKVTQQCPWKVTLHGLSVTSISTYVVVRPYSVFTIGNSAKFNKGIGWWHNQTLTTLWLLILLCQKVVPVQIHFRVSQVPLFRSKHYIRCHNYHFWKIFKLEWSGSSIRVFFHILYCLYIVIFDQIKFSNIFPF